MRFVYILLLAGLVILVARMHCKQLITLFITLCSLENMGITAESRYVYPISIEDVSDYLLPSSRKPLNKRPLKFPTTSEPDSSELKYLLLVKPTGASAVDTGIAANFDDDDDIEYQPKGPPKNFSHLRKPPGIYPSDGPESGRVLSERPRFHSHPITSNKQILSMVFPQSERDDSRSELRASKRLPRGRAERLIKKKPRLDADDDANDDGIDYQFHEFGGPKTYKFGYDTGKGKDRHFHNEDRNPSGHIKGRYGYGNPIGRPTIVKYTANPEGGFRIEKVI